MATGFGRSPPDPRLSASIELSGRDARGLFDLVGIGKTLPGQRIATEETPPAPWRLRKPRSCWNEDVMEARMLGHLGSGLSTVMEARDYP